MKTPAGIECKFFYGDYYRGRNHEECRLIGNVNPPHHWTRDLCQKCPVPGILRANACEFMKLNAQVTGLPFGFMRKVKVSAYCTFSQQNVAEPQIGCGKCHPLPDVFAENKK
jgi:hypothetical protein